jgi:DNA-binding transcriptional ArsR family regulator
MDAKKDLTEIAALIGEPARISMLWTLIGGDARPASELARAAGVSAQNASAHLARLAKAGLLVVEAKGRHRMYKIAGPETAHAVEALAALAAFRRNLKKLPPGESSELKFARTCYDHLAGRAAVEICEAMKSRGYLIASGEDFQVTDEGEKWFSDFGLDVREIRQWRRMFARQCQDWSEQRPHLAGALGAAVLEQMVRREWIKRVRSTRVILVTAKGKKEVSKRLGVML